MFETRQTRQQIGIRQRSITGHCRLGRATELVYILATGATLVIGGQAQADDLTWTGSASQIWDTTTTNWTPGAGAVAFADGDNVTFDGSAVGTIVMQDGGTGLHNPVNVTFDATGYTIAADVSETLDVDGVLTVTNAGDSAEISARIYDGVTVEGAGDLTLSGGNGNAFTSTGVTMGGTGTLSLTGGTFFDGLVANDGLTVIDGGAFDSGSSTITMNGGDVQVSSDISLGGGISVNAGALTIDGGVDQANASRVNGNVVFNNTGFGSSLDLQGVINGALTINDAGSYSFGSNNTSPAYVLGQTTLNHASAVATTGGNVFFQGGLDVQAGTLNHQTAVLQTANLLTNSGTITTASGTTMFLIGGAQNNGTMTLLGDTRETNEGQTLTNNGTLNIRGNVQIDLVNAAGTTTITGNTNMASFGGVNQVVSVTGGELDVGSGRTLTVAGGVTVSGTGVLDLDGTITGPVAFGGSGSSTITGGTITGDVTHSGGALTMSGARIAGTYDRTGAGSVVISDAANPGGNTTTVITGNADFFGGGSLVVDAGQTLDVQARMQNGGGSSATINGTVKATNGLFNIGGASMTFADGGRLETSYTQNNTGTTSTTVTGDFTVTGQAVVNQGTLTINGTGGADGTPTFTVGGAGLQFDGAGTVNNYGEIVGNVTMGVGATFNLDGDIDGNLTYLGGALNVLGDATVTGTMNVLANGADIGSFGGTALTMTVNGGVNVGSSAVTGARLDIAQTLDTTDLTVFAGNTAVFLDSGLIRANVTNAGTFDLSGSDFNIDGDLTLQSGGQIINSDNGPAVLTLNGTTPRTATLAGTLDGNTLGSLTVSADTIALRDGYSESGSVILDIRDTLDYGVTTSDWTLNAGLNDYNLIVQTGSTVAVADGVSATVGQNDTTTSMRNHGTVSVGAGSSLHVLGNTTDNDGLITIADGGAYSDDGAINNLASPRGEIRFDGAGTLTSDVLGGADGITNRGDINLNGSGDTVTFATGGTGTLTNTGTGQIAIGDNTLDVSDFTGGLANTGDATITMSGGQITGNVTNTSTVAQSFGGTITGAYTQDSASANTSFSGATTLGSFVNTQGTLNVDNALTLNGASSNAGTLNVSAAITGGQTITNTGMMGVSANITGNVVNQGTATLGPTTITGTYTQNTSGTASTTIDDTVTVNSVAVSAGSLTINASQSLVASGGVTVNGTGVLTSPGFILGDVTLGGTGTHSVGNNTNSIQTVIFVTPLDFTLTQNEATSTVNISSSGGQSWGTLANDAGTMNIQAGTWGVLVQDAVTNADTLNVDGALLLSSATVTNTGTMNVDGSFERWTGTSSVINTGSGIANFAGETQVSYTQDSATAATNITGTSTFVQTGGEGGDVNINAGSMTVAAGQSLTYHSLTIADGASFATNGGANIRGTGNTTELDGDADYFGNDTLNDDFSIEIGATGDVTLDTTLGDIHFDADDDENGTGTIDNLGLLTVLGGNTVTMGDGGAGNDDFQNQTDGTNNGRFSVTGAGTTVSGIATLTNTSAAADAITVGTGATLGFTTLNSSAGTITAAGTLGGDVNLTGNAGLDLNGGTITGTLDNQSTTAITLSGAVNGAFSQQGAGVQATVDGPMTFGSTVDIDTGTVIIAADTTATGTVSVDGTGAPVTTLTIADGATLTAEGAIGINVGSTAGSTTSNTVVNVNGNIGRTVAGGSALTNAAGTVNLGNGGTTTVAGAVIQNGGAMVVTGDVDINNVGATVGVLDINGGTLNVVSGTLNAARIDLADADGVTLGAGAALTTDAGTSGDIIIADQVDVGAGGRIIAGDDLTIQSTGSVTFADGGELGDGGVTPGYGNVIVNRGDVVVNAGAVITNNSWIWLDDATATLAVNGGSLSLGSGGIEDTAAGAGATVTVTAGTEAATLSAASATMDGGGDVTLTGNGAFNAELALNGGAGTLSIDGGSDLLIGQAAAGAGYGRLHGNLQVNGASFFDINGALGGTVEVSGNVDQDGTSALNELAGEIAGYLRQDGTGTITVTADSDVGGLVDLNRGVLNVNADQTLTAGSADFDAAAPGVTLRAATAGNTTTLQTDTTLTNASVITVAGGGTLRAGTVLTNSAGGQILFQNTGVVTDNVLDSTTNDIRNAGAIRVLSGASVTSTGDDVVTQTGTGFIAVNGGSLSLNGGSVASTSAIATPISVVAAGGNDAILTAAAVSSAAGTVAVTANANGTATLDADTTLTGSGTITLTSEPAPGNRATLDGTLALNSTGTSNIDGDVTGTLTQTDGAVHILATGSGNSTVTGAILIEGAGGTSTPEFFIDDNATLNASAGVTVRSTSGNPNDSLLWVNGDVNGPALGTAITNEGGGLIVNSANTGTVTVTGSVLQTSGTMRFDGATDIQGTLTLDGRTAGFFGIEVLSGRTVQASAIDLNVPYVAGNTDVMLRSGAVLEASTGNLENAGTVRIEAGGRLGAMGSVVNELDALIIFENGGILSAGDVSTGAAASGTVSNNAGGILIGGTVTDLGNDTLDNGGGIRIQGGGTLSFGTISNQPWNGVGVGGSNTVGRISLDDTATLQATVALSNAGLIEANGATATILSAGTFDNTSTGILRLIDAAPTGQTLNITATSPFTNAGLITMADGETNDVVAITGNAVLNGVIAMDVNVSGALQGTSAADDADQITVTGTATGAPELALKNVNAVYSSIGTPITLIKAADTTGLNATKSGLPANAAYVYNLNNTGTEVQLTSTANLGFGGLASGVAATQSLISTVVNRPSSALVTPLVVPGDDPCALGTWGRATAGRADASLETSSTSATSTLSNDISLRYRGVQVGFDHACSGGYYNGWDLALGAMLGTNGGDTRLPVTFGGTATELRTEFDQLFGGLYLSAAKGNWFGDLTLRADRTTYSLNETASFGAGGLGIRDQKFDSRGRAISGSLSYSHTLNAEKSIRLVPTVGFSFSQIETDSIAIDNDPSTTLDDATLQISDMHQKIGYIGATLARTQVEPSGDEATTYFLTGTYFNDFGDDLTSTFRVNSTGASQVLTSENLGGFGELSIGMNRTKILDGGSALPARQMDASVRIDSRFSDRLDSWGLTGQVRFQF